MAKYKYALITYNFNYKIGKKILILFTMAKCKYVLFTSSSIASNKKTFDVVCHSIECKYVLITSNFKLQLTSGKKAFDVMWK